MCLKLGHAPGIGNVMGKLIFGIGSRGEPRRTRRRCSLAVVCTVVDELSLSDDDGEFT